MAIEKMSLINLIGNMDDLDQTLLVCLRSGYFHPEMAIHTTEPSHGFKILEGENLWTPVLSSLRHLASDLEIDLHETDFDPDRFNLETVTSFVEGLEGHSTELAEQKRSIKENILQHEQALIQLKHLEGLNISFDDIFACQYVKSRFGRLPKDSFAKLAYYDDRKFFFFPFDHDAEYYWGVYFAPATKAGSIDDIFASLYFERIYIPDYAHGTPEQAYKNLTDVIESEKKKLAEVQSQIDALKKKSENEFLAHYCAAAFWHKVYDMRKYVAVLNNRFYVVGFVPAAQCESFRKEMDVIESVSFVSKPHDADPSVPAPVKLKNNRFTKPFEMFVNMYSLPSYKDIDPTSLVAITYTLLFGIMFGDLGQGLLLALAGLIFYKWKKMNLGRIMIRIGFSSAFFGLVYGSVFGYEHLLDPMYKALFGLHEKPVEVFNTNTTNMLLMLAIFIGVTLIAVSICINIYLGFRDKDYERAVFGHNGIAGLVFYLGAVFAVSDMMLLNTGIVGLPYILLVLVLPLLLIFFKHAITAVLFHKGKPFPNGIGEFIIENFFELFEYVLSYLSNSMSFLRVGGFILSHAGMMAVVMSLAEMVGAGAGPVVVVIGNLFVMCLEGLIVGIQVLRLEFYEIFSRNFEGNGKPYEPAVVDYTQNA